MCLVLRLWHLGSDPPAWLSWSTGVLTDEGFYNLDARHIVLFGRLAPGNFHDIVLSPLLVEAQHIWFLLVGTRLVDARMFDVLCGMLTLFVLWAGVREVHGDDAADVACLLLGLSPVALFYNRLALQETPATLILLSGYWFWAVGHKSERWWCLVLAGFVTSSVVVVKSLGLASVFALGASAHGESKEFRNRAFKYVVSGAVLGVVLYVLLWYLPHQDTLRRMTTYFRINQVQPRSVFVLLGNIRRGVGNWHYGILPFVLRTMPVPVLATVASLRINGRDRSAYMTFWLLAGVTFYMISSYTPSRYLVLFLPPLCVIAALALCGMPADFRTKAITLAVVTSLAWDVVGLASPTYTEENAQRLLAQSLSPRATIVGEFAPEMCFGSDFRTSTVQPGLANYLDPISETKCEYIAVTRSPLKIAWWKRHVPSRVFGAPPVCSMPLRGADTYWVDVYAVDENH